MSTTPLRVIPLGGLGEIGLNLLVLEYGDTAIAIDCGVMFPDAEMPGIDVAIPDVTYLRGLGERFRAIFLTHGHEDHIGALPYVLAERPVPVYGTPLTLGFVRERLREHGLSVTLAAYGAEPCRVGPFAVEPFAMTHSIPDSVGLAIRTPVGTVVHTGDFKLDLTPVDGRRTDVARLGELGRHGVLVLLSDSTNAERPGFTASEATVGVVMRDLIRDHPDRRFIVASFASHLHRVQQVAREAVAAGRHVAFLGRSMTQNVTLARDMGLLDLPVDRVIDAEDVTRYAPGEVCIICTGSQGEPMSALALMASHEHKFIKVSNDDIVVLSAHAIPGNEPNVHKVIDGLHRAGAMVIHDSTTPVHVSGHASSEELKFVIGLVNPEWFVPVHGEYRHMVHHAALARDMGLEGDHILVCEDGDAITIDDTSVDVERRAVPAGYQFVDGIGGDISHGVLRDRRTLGEEGFVVVIVTVDAGTGEIITGPEIVTRGWVYEAEADELLEDAKAAVRAALRHDEGPVEFEALRRNARRALGKLINERTRRRPAVIPVILEV